LSSEQIVTSTIQQINPKISLNSQQKKIRNLTLQIPCFRSIGSPEQALGEYLNQTGGELKKEGSIQLAASSGEETDGLCNSRSTTAKLHRLPC